MATELTQDQRCHFAAEPDRVITYLTQNQRCHFAAEHDRVVAYLTQDQRCHFSRDKHHRLPTNPANEPWTGITRHGSKISVSVTHCRASSEHNRLPLDQTTLLTVVRSERWVGATAGRGARLDTQADVALGAVVVAHEVVADGAAGQAAKQAAQLQPRHLSRRVRRALVLHACQDIVRVETVFRKPPSSNPDKCTAGATPFFYELVNKQAGALNTQSLSLI